MNIATNGSNGKFAPSQRHRGSFVATKTQTCFLSADYIINGYSRSDDSLLSNKKAEEDGAVKRTWNKWMSA